MSYLEFILVFLCPWIALGLILLFKRNEPIRAVLFGVISVSLSIALVFTFLLYALTGPDVQHELLVFNLIKSLQTYDRLPLEIPLLLFCQSVMSGFILFFIRPRIHPTLVPSLRVKGVGALVLIIFIFLGVIMLGNPVTSHTGALLLWGGIILLAQWFFGSSLVWRTKGMFALTVLISSMYFSIIEGVAIKSHLWAMGDGSNLGIDFLGIPFERILFQIILAASSCQGLEIFWRHFQKSEFSQKQY